MDLLLFLEMSTSRVFVRFGPGGRCVHGQTAFICRRLWDRFVSAWDRCFCWEKNSFFSERARNLVYLEFSSAFDEFSPHASGQGGDLCSRW